MNGINICPFPVPLPNHTIISRLFLQPALCERVMSRSNSVVLSDPHCLDHSSQFLAFWSYSPGAPPRSCINSAALSSALCAAGGFQNPKAQPGPLLEHSPQQFSWSEMLIRQQSPKYFAVVWRGSSNGFPYPILKVSTSLISPLFLSRSPTAVVLELPNAVIL